MIRTVLRHIESVENEDALITVLIPEVIPEKRCHEVPYYQRGRILETVLKARANVMVARIPFRLQD